MKGRHFSHPRRDQSEAHRWMNIHQHYRRNGVTRQGINRLAQVLQDFSKSGATGDQFQGSPFGGQE